MTKKSTILFIFIALLVGFNGVSEAFWLWTPKGKFINPRFAVKDTPEAQFEWAMSFYEAKDYVRAAEEFVRLAQVYDNSKLAPDALYYAGMSYKYAGKLYSAFQNFQKVLKDYPHTRRTEDIITAELEIGQLFFDSSKASLMGIQLLTDYERALEIFQSITDTVPYAKNADEAQFMIGQCYAKLGQYSEANEAYAKLINEYPSSSLIDKAKYEAAQSLFLASSKSEYDQEKTDDAIQEFEKYKDETRDDKILENIDESISALREKRAKSVYEIAEFYKRQKKYSSADRYYNQIIKEYGDTSVAKDAEGRINDIKPLLEKQARRKK